MDSKIQSLFVTIPLALGLISLAACDGPADSRVKYGDGPARYVITFDDSTLYVDSETGCEYIIYGPGITIRVDEHGRPICHKQNEKTESSDR